MDLLRGHSAVAGRLSGRAPGRRAGCTDQRAARADAQHRYVLAGDDRACNLTACSPPRGGCAALPGRRDLPGMPDPGHRCGLNSPTTTLRRVREQLVDSSLHWRHRYGFTGRLSGLEHVQGDDLVARGGCPDSPVGFAPLGAADR